MTGHLHVTPETRVEAHAIAHVLRTTGFDVRLGPARPGCEGDMCAGSVVLALDGSPGTLESVLAGGPEAGGRVLAIVDGDPDGGIPETNNVTVVRWLESTNCLAQRVTSFLAGDVSAVRSDLTRDRPAATGLLTAREEEIAGLLANGWRNEEIALELGISGHTVRTHVSRVLSKLEVQHRVALMVKLRRDPRVPLQRQPASRVAHGTSR